MQLLMKCVMEKIMFNWVGRFKVRMAVYDANWYLLEKIFPNINELAKNEENRVISKPLWTYYLNVKG